MAVSDEIKEQTSKFKYMTKEQKKDYIWTYYKWWIIGALALVIGAIMLINAIIENSKPVLIDVIFLNSDYQGSTVDSPLASDFMGIMGADPKEYNIDIDYNSYMDNNYGNQKSMAGQVKLMSRYSAEEVDICCGPELVMTDAADVGGYYDFEKAFTKEELKKLEDAGYELFYYTEKEYLETKSANEEPKYVEGETYVGGIYIDKCDKLINKYGVYSENVFDQNKDNGRFILTIAANTTKLDTAKEFIYFVTDIR